MTVTSTVPVPGEARGLAGETAVMDVLLFTVNDVAAAVPKWTVVRRTAELEAVRPGDGHRPSAARNVGPKVGLIPVTCVLKVA